MRRHAGGMCERLVGVGDTLLGYVSSVIVCYSCSNKGGMRKKLERNVLFTRVCLC